jgi:hypothetical protein
MTARVTIDIRPIEIDGQFYVGVTMDGHETSRRGPFFDAAAAESAAERMRQIGRALTNSQLSGRRQHG